MEIEIDYRWAFELQLANHCEQKSGRHFEMNLSSMIH